jgi:hypothetical protein
LLFSSLPVNRTLTEGEIYPNSGVTAKGVIRLARELQ